MNDEHWNLFDTVTTPHLSYPSRMYICAIRKAILNFAAFLKRYPFGSFLIVWPYSSPVVHYSESLFLPFGLDHISKSKRTKAPDRNKDKIKE